MQLILGSSSAGRREVMSSLGVRFSTMRPDIDEKAVRHEDSYVLPVVVAAAKCKALLDRVRIPAVIVTADQVVIGPAGARAEAGAGADGAAAEASASGGAASSSESAALDLASRLGLSAGDPVVGLPLPGGDGTAPPGGNGRAACAVEVREKPRDAAEAADFISRYSGSWVQCVSAVVVHNTRTGQRAAGLDVVTVEFDDIPASAVAEAVRPVAGAPPAVLSCAGGVMIEHDAIKPFVRRLGGPEDSVFGLPKTLLRDLLAAVGGPVIPESDA